MEDTKQEGITPLSRMETSEEITESAPNIDDRSLIIPTDSRDSSINGIEMFVYGFPAYFQGKEWTALLDQLGIQYIRTKKAQSCTFAHLTLKDTETFEFAKQKLDNYKLKEFVLNVKTARKRLSITEKEEQNKRRKKNNPDIIIVKNVNDAVTPLASMPYDKQLQKKTKQMGQILKKVVVQIQKDSSYNVPAWIRTKHGQMCCPFEGILAAPVLEGYRNKVNFTIGLDSDGKPCIGFALGKTSEGITIVGDALSCVNVSFPAKQICSALASYILDSSLIPFDKRTHKGFWRQLTVRNNESGEVMVCVQVQPDDVLKEEIEKVKTLLVECLTAKDILGKIQLKSIMWQEFSGVCNAAPMDWPYDLLWGDNYIYEHLLGLKFRISLNSFFQVNTKAAEVLCKVIAEWSGVDKETTLFDVCCGTGTIGLVIAKYVKEVIGIEMVPEAIIDAKENAELNGITNTSFVVGKAEDVLHGKLKEKKNEQKCVGIVDPPRAGMHLKAIKAIRQAEFIKRLVYVSCKQGSFVVDCGRLCKSPSKTMLGAPFKPVKAIAVDMFPHTEHCELVVLFERQ